MSTILEMKAERARVWEQMKALTDIGAEETRIATSEEQEIWDRMNAEIDDLSFRCDQSEKNERLDAIRASLDSGSRSKAVGKRTVSEVFLDEFRAFLHGELRYIDLPFNAQSNREARTLLASATPGSFAVPVDFVNAVREYLIDFSGVRQTNATILTTAGGVELRIPRATGHPTAALIGESAAITPSDPVLSNVVLGSFKYANLQYLTKEFLEDEVVNILDYLARQNGIALANATGAAFVIGTGAAQPQGVNTIAGTGVTGAVAAVAVLTSDNLIDLYHSVLVGYRRNSYFLMRDATIAAIRKLKETTGQYLWQPGIKDGQPDTLLGRPIVVDPSMPAIAVSAKSITFGDFSGFYIREVGNIRIERSDDFKFDTDIVTFRTVMRVDSDLVDASCVKNFVHGAAI